MEEEKPKQPDDPSPPQVPPSPNPHIVNMWESHQHLALQSPQFFYIYVRLVIYIKGAAKFSLYILYIVNINIYDENIKNIYFF